MAFTFPTIEPVKFGDFEAVPKMTAEAQLRLSQLKISPENLDEAAKAIAECFGENAEKVEEILRANRLTMEYQRLQAYLLQGQKGLELIDKLLEESINDNLEKALKVAQEDNENEAEEKE